MSVTWEDGGSAPKAMAPRATVPARRRKGFTFVAQDADQSGVFGETWTLVKAVQRVMDQFIDDHGFDGSGLDREAHARSREDGEAFIPLVSIPGESEADFQESWVEIAGKRVKAHCFLMVLPYEIRSGDAPAARQRSISAGLATSNDDPIDTRRSSSGMAGLAFTA